MSFKWRYLDYSIIPNPSSIGIETFSSKKVVWIPWTIEDEINLLLDFDFQLIGLT